MIIGYCYFFDEDKVMMVYRDQSGKKAFYFEYEGSFFWCVKKIDEKLTFTKDKTEWSNFLFTTDNTTIQDQILFAVVEYFDDSCKKVFVMNNKATWMRSLDPKSYQLKLEDYHLAKGKIDSLFPLS